MAAWNICTMPVIASSWEMNRGRHTHDSMDTEGDCACTLSEQKCGKTVCYSCLKFITRDSTASTMTWQISTGAIIQCFFLLCGKLAVSLVPTVLFIFLTVLAARLPKDGLIQTLSDAKIFRQDTLTFSIVVLSACGSADRGHRSAISLYVVDQTPLTRGDTLPTYVASIMDLLQ